MNKDRLTRMVDLLKRDAANPKGVKFDLGIWAAPARHGVTRWGGIPDGEPLVVATSCGTKACAFGLAAISGEFAEDGLNYKFGPEVNGTRMLVPTFEGEECFGAAATFFDIKYNDASYLFDPESYEETPREAEGELFVAQRISDFIDGKIDHDYHQSYC